MLKFATLTAASVLLAACASTPDVTYHYYLAKARTTLSATQTITCTKDNAGIVVVTTAQQPATIYMADTAAGPYDLPARSLDGAFSDANVTITLSEDGRLKGLNATQTGEGQAILNSAIGLVGAALKGGGESGAKPLVTGAAKKPKIGPACAIVQNHGGTITLTYAEAVDLGAKYVQSQGADYNEPPPVSDKTTLDALDKVAAVPTIGLDIAFSPNEGGASSPCKDTTQPMVTLRKTVNALVQINIDNSPASSTLVTVPARDTYCLALSKAAMFGNDQVALTLFDSGAITSLQNNKTNGGAQAIGTAQTFVTTVVPSAPAAPASGGH
ncbi:MAG TPA: hypothetical protein VGF56_05085 [Rhizomicrobium sp.]